MIKLELLGLLIDSQNDFLLNHRSKIYLIVWGGVSLTCYCIVHLVKVFISIKKD